LGLAIAGICLLASCTEWQSSFNAQARRVRGDQASPLDLYRGRCRGSSL
jgi:hypothetical protein